MKQERTIFFMESNKSNVTSLTVLSCSCGICRKASMTVSDLVPPDDCYQAFFASMFIPVGDYRIQVPVRQGRLINSQIWTYVLRKDKPLVRMVELTPGMITS